VHPRLPSRPKPCCPQQSPQILYCGVEPPTLSSRRTIPPPSKLLHSVSSIRCRQEKRCHRIVACIPNRYVGYYARSHFIKNDRRNATAYMVSKWRAIRCRDGIARACAASLARLGSEYWILSDALAPQRAILRHGWPRLNNCARRERFALGVSNFSVGQMEDLFAFRGHRCATNQVPTVSTTAASSAIFALVKQQTCDHGYSRRRRNKW